MAGQPTTAAGVFISYRRQETGPYARLLHQELRKHFEAERVFMDVDSIEVGVDFEEAIRQAVGACSVLLALVGPNWLSATDSTGQRRLDDPEDTVRLEIEAALKRQVLVIPILIDGTAMPRRHELPETIAPLARRNALELSYIHYDYDLGRLMKSVERALNQQPVTPVLVESTTAIRPEVANGGAVDLLAAPSAEQQQIHEEAYSNWRDAAVLPVYLALESSELLDDEEFHKAFWVEPNFVDAISMIQTPLKFACRTIQFADEAIKRMPLFDPWDPNLTIPPLARLSGGRQIGPMLRLVRESILLDIAGLQEQMCSLYQPLIVVATFGPPDDLYQSWRFDLTRLSAFGGDRGPIKPILVPYISNRDDTAYYSKLALPRRGGVSPLCMDDSLEDLLNSIVSQNVKKIDVVTTERAPSTVDDDDFI